MKSNPHDFGHSPRQDDCLSEWIAQYRSGLRYMVELRMDKRLRSRVDPSDILQEAFCEASIRLDDYREKQPMPPRLWLRYLAKQQLLIAYRKHVVAKSRDVTREQKAHSPTSVSSDALLECLVQTGTTPSQIVSRAEDIANLQTLLGSLDEIDREVLAMRHFEELSVAETAQSLGISEAAAGQRYYRALKRISTLMQRRDDQDSK